MTVSKGTEMETKIISACRKACLEAVEDLFDATSYIVEHAAEWGGEAVSWKNRPAPMLFFHGSADPVVPFGKGNQFEGPDAPLTIEDRFTEPDNGPMIKRYLLSGYFYPAEEIAQWVQQAFPEATGN